MILTKELEKFAAQFSRSSAQHQDEAEDFYQEIMIVFHRIDRENTQVDAPLKRKIARSAARNRIRDLVKRRNVRVKYHVPLDENLIVLADPLLRIEARLLLAQIGGGDRIAESILGYLVEGFTVEEVAEEICINKRMIYRILERMRASLHSTEYITISPERGDTIQND